MRDMRVLLVSTLRDEGPHLLEWIAHHRAIGVNDFLLFSNDCSDGTDAMLEALAPFGVVHLRNTPDPGKSLQWSAFKAAWDHPLRKDASHILGIDSDEFINLRKPLTTLSALIEAAGDPDALVLPWRLFGHNARARLEPGLTTEQFTRAAPPDCAYPVGARQFKTLFRRDGPFRQIGVHRPRLKGRAEGAHWADGSGNRLPENFANAEQRLTLYGLPEASALVQLNHYSVRSAENFMVKRARGLPNRKGKSIDLTYWVERNFNTVEDASIAHLAPGTRAVLDQFMGLPGMARLYDAAVAWHHAKFEDLMRDPFEVKLFGRLLLSMSSTPLPEDIVHDLVSRFQASSD